MHWNNACSIGLDTGPRADEHVCPAGIDSQAEDKNTVSME
jgi:hypothetical protein